MAQMECLRNGLYANTSGVSVRLQSHKSRIKEEVMTRFESSNLLDSFSLEAAARRHRSEGYGKAFDAAVNWVESHLQSLARGFDGFTTPAAVRLHRSSTH
jgi:hypothetical protein